MTFDYLKNATSPTTLVTIAAFVGMLVRILKTKKVSDLLDAFPAKWVKAIPGKYLSWVACALGFGITMLDAHLNGGVTSWREAFWVGMAGVLAGGTAVGGHETVAKLVGSVIYKPAGPLDPPPPSPGTPEAELKEIKEKQVADIMGIYTADPPPEDTKVEKPVKRATLLFPVLTAISMAVALLTATPGCAALGAALPGIIAAILDGAQILDAIEKFVSEYFIAHPDPAAQAKVNAAMVKCRSALNIALRSAQATKELDEKQVDKAFDDFKAAYIELIGLCKPYGVKPSSNGKLSAAPGTLEVPEPTAFTRHGVK